MTNNENYVQISSQAQLRSRRGTAAEFKARVGLYNKVDHLVKVNHFVEPETSQNKLW